MKKILGILLLLLMPAAGVLAQTRKQKRKAIKKMERIIYGTVQSRHFNERIHFQNILGHLFLKVMIHGKEYCLAYDTGALTLLSDELLKELNLPVAGNINIVGQPAAKERKGKIYINWMK